jgi:hypothetical protein
LKSLSPSSRLVLAAVALAFLVLAIVGSLQPTTSTPSASAISLGGSGGSPSSPGLAAASGTAAGVSPGPEQEASAPAATSAPTRAPTAPASTPKPPACVATDQNRYVYNPSRLAVQAACIRVTGTVAAVRHEADGDLHILLALDPAYSHLLRPANQGEELGDLVIEPVCVRTVTQADAIATCAADPDPLSGPFPAVGATVWMEGRYVFDLDHGGWAEIHPLYRWGNR